jgi:hypothetical protein
MQSLLSRTPTTLAVISTFCLGTGVTYQFFQKDVKNTWMKQTATVTEHTEKNWGQSAIKFEYDINETHYKCEADPHTEIFPETKEDFFARFPIGHTMEVYVNPEKLDKALLRRDTYNFNDHVLFCYLAGVSLAIMSVGIRTANHPLTVLGLLTSPVGLNIPYRVLARDDAKKRDVEIFLNRTDTGASVPKESP